MNSKIRILATLLISFCFLLKPAGVFPQETEFTEELTPLKRNIFADVGYAILGSITSNIFLNLGARHNNQSFAQMNFEKIWHNISQNESILFVPLGSIMWEVFLEPEPYVRYAF